MQVDELKQRLEELEAQLAARAHRTERLRAQGLHELADREKQRWEQVSREYVRVGNQLEDLRHQQPREPAPTSAAPAGYTEKEWRERCAGC